MATEAMQAMANVVGKVAGFVSIVCVGVGLVSWVGCVEGTGKTVIEGISRVKISCGAISGWLSWLFSFM